jgi:hypothetical protein
MLSRAERLEYFKRNDLNDVMQSMQEFFPAIEQSAKYVEYINVNERHASYC